MARRDHPAMPIAPAFGPVERFDPRYISDQDLAELSSFTRRSREECLDRVKQYSMAELAEAWRAADPHGPNEVLDFYSSTDLYIWEQMQWHASPDRSPYWRALQALVRDFPPAGHRRVLEFGAGIGTDGLFLATQGYTVTLVDVDGPAFRFARHRFERRGLSARFVESRSMLPKPDAEYDVVVCFDVFEHLPDPLEAARRLVSALRPGGVLLETGSFVDEGLHPCHIHDGIRRFGEGRWEIYLAGVGLRGGGMGLFIKPGIGVALIQRLRFLTWRATGLWLSRTPR
jgi:2-polyprenyl-3-methyl-5-hydroxy-6-metoxy-1,4-benzoquinol methylase